MHRNLTMLTSITALALLTVSGCAASGPEPTGPTSAPSDSISPTATPTPTLSPSPSMPESSPTPEAPDVDLADPSGWQISADGIGPIAAGGDFAATLAELPATWSNDAHCSWAAWWNAEDQSYSVDFVRGTESEQEPIVLVSTSAADPITPGVGPRTEDGLGIGSTKDEVLAQHPDAMQGQSQVGEGTWIGVPTEGATIFFEYYTGDSEQANAVTVTTLEAPPYEVCG